MVTLVAWINTLSFVLRVTMLGQAILWLLAGRARDSNLIYRFFRKLTRPLFALLRSVPPKAIADAAIPALGFVLVAIVFIVSVLAYNQLLGRIDLSRLIA